MRALSSAAMAKSVNVASIAAEPYISPSATEIVGTTPETSANFFITAEYAPIAAAPSCTRAPPESHKNTTGKPFLPPYR